MTPANSIRSASVATALALVLPVALAAGGAQAAPLTGVEVLQQFNLVVLGNMSGGHDVEGRALIGGNLTGNRSTTFFTRGDQAPASEYQALSIGGNLAGGPVNVNNGGGVAVGGNVTKNVNLNGGGTAYVGGAVTGGANINGNKVVGQPVAVPNFVGAINQLSSDLKDLAANATATYASNRASFDASGHGGDAVVFNIANGAAFFSSVTELAFTIGTADTVVVNVGGNRITLNENWLGGVGQQVADNIIWNFYEATSLTFATEYFGSILAPLANLSNGNALNGAVVAANFTQRGAVRQYLFSGEVPGGTVADTVAAGDVPEPPPLGLLALGLLGLIASIHRSKP